ncbi:hypothetical protein LAZ67_21002756, partial [Cordylochernes scorpioides]
MMLDDLNDDMATSDPNFKGLSMAEVIAQGVLFFIAGYDTTASTISYCVYNLALNPECQDRLAAEVDKILSEPDVSLDYDSVKNMSYLEAVISETLRIYPPLSRVERQAQENYKLGDINIPKDMVVQIPVYAIHHDPENYPEPDKFDPERFLPENKDNIRPFTYLPFGTGPRNCLAERFALLEVKLCLAQAIRRFRFSRVPETKVDSNFFNFINILTQFRS